MLVEEKIKELGTTAVCFCKPPVIRSNPYKFHNSDYKNVVYGWCYGHLSISGSTMGIKRDGEIRPEGRE